MTLFSPLKTFNLSWNLYNINNIAMIQSLFRIIFLTTSFLLFYFSSLYLIEPNGFFVPLMLLTNLFFLFFLVVDKELAQRTVSILFKVTLVVLLVVFSYVLYKIFYLNLGYAL